MIPFGDEPEERKVKIAPKRARGISGQAVLFGDEPEEKAVLFGDEPEEKPHHKQGASSSSSRLFGPEPEESSAVGSGIESDPSDDEGLVLEPKTLTVDTCLVFVIFVGGLSKLSLIASLQSLADCVALLRIGVDCAFFHRRIF